MKKRIDTVCSCFMSSCFTSLFWSFYEARQAIAVRAAEVFTGYARRRGDVAGAGAGRGDHAAAAGAVDAADLLPRVAGGDARGGSAEAVAGHRADGAGGAEHAAGDAERGDSARRDVDGGRSR